MSEQRNPLLVKHQRSASSKRSSALGIGITTLVTIMVVLLLAAFAVLSLASARSDLSLSRMAVEQTALYYAADSEACAWYAELDAFTATLAGTPSEYAAELTRAGYDAQLVEGAEESELRITHSFAINEYRSLVVTIAVNADKTTTVRQWQS